MAPSSPRESSLLARTQHRSKRRCRADPWYLASGGGSPRKHFTGQRPPQGRDPVTHRSPANLEREPVPLSLVSARLVARSESRCSKLLKSPLPVGAGRRASHHLPRGRVTFSRDLESSGLLHPGLPPAAWVVLPPRGMGDSLRSWVAPDQRPQLNGTPACSFSPRFYRSPLGARGRARCQTAPGSLQPAPCLFRSPQYEQALCPVG